MASSTDERNSVRAVFVDFRKALDYVDHSTVLTEMAVLGIYQSAIRWMHSFLSDHQQRVKIVPEWKSLAGGMPQGTWFGPYVFIMLIDSLCTINDTYKCVDDVTLTEIIIFPVDSQMLLALNQVAAWSQLNYTNINAKKMLLGPVRSHLLIHIVIHSSAVEQVTSVKLIGVVITNSLQWVEHVTAICVQVNKRLHFLKLLKRSGVATADLLQYYKSCSDSSCC
jgi:Reverse transcriptase (RNA-dependent DNA polymerase)